MVDTLIHVPAWIIDTARYVRDKHGIGHAVKFMRTQLTSSVYQYEEMDYYGPFELGQMNTPTVESVIWYVRSL